MSPEVRDELVAHGVAPAEKFTVIRLGIPLDERLGDATADLDYRRLYGIPEDAFVVGWVGRMTGVKDTSAVLEIVRATRERGVPAVLCMVGDGPDRERLEQVAHELGIARSTLLRRLPGGRRRLLPALRRLPAPVRERGHTRERDRGARVGDAGRRDAGRRRARRGDATASTDSSSSRETSSPPRMRLAELAGDPELRARFGEAGSAQRARALLGRAPRRRRRPALPRAARREGTSVANHRSRRGTSRGRARAACAAGSRDRPSASGSRRTRRRARSGRPTAATRGRAPGPSPSARAGCRADAAGARRTGRPGSGASAAAR